MSVDERWTDETLDEVKSHLRRLESVVNQQTWEEFAEHLKKLNPEGIRFSTMQAYVPTHPHELWIGGVTSDVMPIRSGIIFKEKDDE